MDTIFYKVIGVMSGTSLDGLDLAYCHFSINNTGKWDFKLINSKSVSYTSELEYSLKNAVNISSEQLLLLDIQYGRWLGIQINDFINENSLEVDFIASHGHTVFHQPEKSITNQIGSGQEIAFITQKDVVCDFRKKDVALGGQGAPLVPIGDQELFAHYLACLNLGGIANVSFNKANERIAFDIGMANMLLNYLANLLGKAYDASGLLARSGTINQTLLDQLNNLSYFQQPFPKSLGYEWFLSDVLPLMEASEISVEDKLATVVEHEAIQIGNVLKDNLSTEGEVLITGGGALNDFLVERIDSYTPKHLKIVIPDKSIIDFKEAIIFAFMGVLKMRNEVNCLKSVTGARQNSSGGEIFQP